MAGFDSADCGSPLLTLGEPPPIVVEGEADLVRLLQDLSSLASGQVARLEFGPRHFIRGTRHADLWSVTVRRGGYLSLASFTAAMTTDYSERTVREVRAIPSIWQRIAFALRAPSPERSLSTSQVRTLFAEFLTGRRFSIPQSGA